METKESIKNELLSNGLKIYNNGSAMYDNLNNMSDNDMYDLQDELLLVGAHIDYSNENDCFVFVV